MKHPSRAVAPDPSVGRNTRARCCRAISLVAVCSHLGGHVSPSPGLSMRQHGREPLAHFVALEHFGLPNDIAEEHRAKAIARPALPASSRVSTAAIYGGRSPAGIRGASASSGRAAVYANPYFAAFLVLRRSRGFRNRGANTGSCPRLRSLRTPEGSEGPTVRQPPGISGRDGQTQAAEPNPACSGLALLAADARG